jgi:hypothetical protein
VANEYIAIHTMAKECLEWMDIVIGHGAYSTAFNCDTEHLWGVCLMQMKANIFCIANTSYIEHEDSWMTARFW